MDENTNPDLCTPCFEDVHGEEPDMGMGATWHPGTCARCRATEVIVFRWDM